MTPDECFYCGDGAYQPEYDGHCEWNLEPGEEDYVPGCRDTNSYGNDIDCTVCGDGVLQNFFQCDYEHLCLPEQDCIPDEQGMCERVCFSGANAGSPCSSDADCGTNKICYGGPNNGEDCSLEQDCGILETCDYRAPEGNNNPAGNDCRDIQFGEDACTYCGDGIWQPDIGEECEAADTCVDGYCVIDSTRECENNEDCCLLDCTLPPTGPFCGDSDLDECRCAARSPGFWGSKPDSDYADTCRDGNIQDTSLITGVNDCYTDYDFSDGEELCSYFLSTTGNDIDFHLIASCLDLSSEFIFYDNYVRVYYDSTCEPASENYVTISDAISIIEQCSIKGSCTGYDDTDVYCGYAKEIAESIYDDHEDENCDEDNCYDCEACNNYDEPYEPNEEFCDPDECGSPWDYSDVQDYLECVEWLQSSSNVCYQKVLDGNNEGVCREDCTCCGDGVVQPEYGEECDDGNLNNSDSCDNDCKVDVCQWCGDGILNGNEECDYNVPDGIDSNQDEIYDNKCELNGVIYDCDLDCQCDCQTTEWCGDGILNGEEYCDYNVPDGVDSNSDEIDDNMCELDGVLYACDNHCLCSCRTTEWCGDGILNGNEDCDYNAGYPDNLCPDSSACDENCLCSGTEPYCGDGVVQDGEVCDYNAPYPGSACFMDGQEYDCNLDCTCSCEEPFCGDGIVSDGEKCDPEAPYPGNKCFIDGEEYDCDVDTCECENNCNQDLSCGNGQWDGEDIDNECEYTLCDPVACSESDVYQNELCRACNAQITHCWDSEAPVEDACRLLSEWQGPEHYYCEDGGECQSNCECMTPDECFYCG
ncbi:MAG: hypothetical protein GF411_10640, partial [Candidatus Lokiarchaeota archaeon]|nr:hypothetical protein [Candidatus Lokiarchaeota archaeon]